MSPLAVAPQVIWQRCVGSEIGPVINVEKEGTWRKCVGASLTPGNHLYQRDPLHVQFDRLERRLIQMTPCSSFKPLVKVKKAANLQSRYMWR